MIRAPIAALLLAAGCAGGVSPARVPLPPSAVAVTAPAADALGARTIPLVRRDGYVFAPTRIDDREVGDFLVDTGAGALLIDLQLADELQLPAVIDTRVAGALAESQASFRQVRSLTAAGLPLESTPAVAVDLGDVNSMGQFSGLIGFPTLGSAPFTIDFARGSLTIHDSERFVPPPSQSALLRINQLPYVEATLEGGLDVWLLLDSGQGAAVTLWQDFVKQHPDVLTVPQKRWAQATGIGGGTQVMVSELRSLRALGEEHGKTQVLIQEQPQGGWHHPRVAGRVGMALLDQLRITIHPAHKRIWIERP